MNDLENLNNVIGSCFNLYQEVQDYIGQWLKYQSLWDMDVHELDSRLKNNLSGWLDVLDEMRQVRKNI